MGFATYFTAAVFMVLSSKLCRVDGQDGVWLSLKGAAIANDGFVDVNDIGSDNENALLCHTDKSDCCNVDQNHEGEWYLPNMSPVGSHIDAGRTNYFFRNRGPSVVRLVRVGAPTASERGRYYCQVPNTNDVIQTIYVNIVALTSVGLLASPRCPSHYQTCTRTISDTSFDLTCSVIEIDDAPSAIAIEWFYGVLNSSLPDGIMTMSGMMTIASGFFRHSSTLQFPSLQLSHAGVYTCRIGGNERLAARSIVTVNVPFQVFLTRPSLPLNLTTEGHCITFACTVALGPGLVESDLSLIEVDTQLYRDGTPLALSGPTLVTETTLTYSTQLDLSVRNITENYTCMATVRPREESPYITTRTNVSNILIITSTGVYISLSGKTYRNNSNILITDIGEGSGRALLCHTDLDECCKSSQTNNSTSLGEWFYPNSSTVSVPGSNENFYRNRGNRRVRLLRRGDSTSPTGQFCCEIPDASYTLIKMCVYLVTDPSNTSSPNDSRCRQSSTRSTTPTPQITLKTTTSSVSVEAIGGGVVAGLVVIAVTLSTILCAIRWYRLKHSKADPAMADDIQMTQNDVYIIAAKIQSDGNRSSGGTLNNKYINLCRVDGQETEVPV